MIWLLRTAMLPMMPSTEHGPGLQADHLDAYLRGFWRDANGATKLGVALGALVFVISPAITVWRPVPSFWLSDETLDRHAHAVATSPIYLVQQAMFLLKMYAGFAWGTQGQVREHLALEPYPDDPTTFRTD